MVATIKGPVLKRVRGFLFLSSLKLCDVMGPTDVWLIYGDTLALTGN